MTQKNVKISDSKPKNFEDILDLIGGFGKFQVFVLVVLTGLDFPSALLSLLPIFIGANPEHWTCDGNVVNAGEICSCNGTLTSSLPQTSIVGEWSLVCGQSWVTDFVTSLQMLGSVLSTLLLSQISDWYGRRGAINSICIVFGIGAILSALAPDIYTFALGRILVGAGSSGSQGLATVYSIEFMPIASRPLPSSVRPYGEAIMLLGVLAYFFRPWRTLAWATTASILIVGCLIPLVPESPRWLMQKGRVAEAHQILTRMAKMNNRPPLDESVVRDVAEKEMGSGATENVGEDGKAVKNSYLTILKDRSLRTRALCLMILWFSWAVVGFGLTFNIRHIPGDPYWNVIYMGMADSLGYPSGLLILNRLGRKASVCLSMTFGAVWLVVLAVLYLTTEVKGHPEIVMLLYLLAKYGYAIARSTLRCLSAESFPTAVRSIGSGLSGVSFSMGLVICPQLVYLGSYDPAIPLLAFAAISVTGCMFAFLMPETKGKPLQDTIKHRI